MLQRLGLKPIPAGEVPDSEEPSYERVRDGVPWNCTKTVESYVILCETELFEAERGYEAACVDMVRLSVAMDSARSRLAAARRRALDEMTRPGVTREKAASVLITAMEAAGIGATELRHLAEEKAQQICAIIKSGIEVSDEAAATMVGMMRVPYDLADRQAASASSEENDSAADISSDATPGRTGGVEGMPDRSDNSFQDGLEEMGAPLEHSFRSTETGSNPPHEGDLGEGGIASRSNGAEALGEQPDDADSGGVVGGAGAPVLGVEARRRSDSDSELSPAPSVTVAVVANDSSGPSAMVAVAPADQTGISASAGSASGSSLQPHRLDQFGMGDLPYVVVEREPVNLLDREALGLRWPDLEDAGQEAPLLELSGLRPSAYNEEYLPIFMREKNLKSLSFIVSKWPRVSPEEAKLAGLVDERGEVRLIAAQAWAFGYGILLMKSSATIGRAANLHGLYLPPRQGAEGLVRQLVTVDAAGVEGGPIRLVPGVDVIAADGAGAVISGEPLAALLARWEAGERPVRVEVPAGG